jgi:Concanavalin A-like lectin/glucanases superfamily
MATFGIRGPSRATHRRSARRALLAVAATAAICAAGPAAARADAALGQWRFDEPAGDTALDGGAYGLDGRLGAAPGADAADPTRIPGLSGGALRFDGGAFVRLPDAPELAPERLTVEAVVRAASSPGQYRYLVSRGGRDCFAGAYGLYTAKAGGVALYVLDGQRFVVSATARAEDVWDGAWHHVAGTFDGGRLRLYVDGRPVGEPSAPVSRIDYGGMSANAAFGRYVGSCDLSFTGDLDLVRLHARGLAAAAIADAAWSELHPAGTVRPPALLPPLSAADPPTTLEAVRPAAPVTAVPGAPERACTLALSRRRIVARRKTRVRVRVTQRGAPVRGVRVVARQRGRAKWRWAARTGQRGRVRLTIRARRPGRVKVSASMLPSCSPATIRVARRR